MGLMARMGKALGDLAKGFASRFGAALRDLIGLCAVGLISYGVWLIYQPWGYIAAGALLLAGCFLSALAGKAPQA